MSKAPTAASGHRFATTQWSMVLRASGTSPSSRDALSRLCECYWYPVYAFIRRQGYSAEPARDLTQEFFARVIERRFFRGANPARGRFRVFVVGAVRHFLSNERRREWALKRGGVRMRLVPLELDTAEERYAIEGHDDLTPDRLFDRRWALLLLDRALGRVREKHAQAGKITLFEHLRPYLTEGGEGAPYVALARSVGLSEGAIKVAVHRLRRQFRDALLEEVAQTVAGPGEINAEIRYLLAAVSTPPTS
jgi:RNA polymerase sigma factor (sigma-70 family)